MTEEDACQHKYVFLRQETKNEGYPRNPNWVAYDVFFCEQCVSYKRVKVNANYAEYTGPKNEPALR